VASLTVFDYALEKYYELPLARIYEEEEIKWLQCSKKKKLLEWDSLNAHFMANTSGRRRRNKIIPLKHENKIFKKIKNCWCMPLGTINLYLDILDILVLFD
jgi:hypothetical protein